MSSHIANGSRGNTKWVIPDGYIPPKSSGELESHESICVLNMEKQDARLSITVFFEDREPLEQIEVVVSARRTSHIRTAGLRANGESIPAGVPYALIVESDTSIIVQYSRLDTTQPELALMSVMAYPV